MVHNNYNYSNKITLFSLFHVPSRLNTGKKIIGQCTVYNTYLKMYLLVTSVQLLSQGSTDPSTPWAKARFPWVK